MPRGIYKRKRKKPHYKHPRHYRAKLRPSKLGEEVKRDVADTTIYSAGDHIDFNKPRPPVMKDGFPYHPKSKLRKAYMLGREDIESLYKHRVNTLQIDLKTVEARIEADKKARNDYQLETDRLRMAEQFMRSIGQATESMAKMVNPRAF